MKLVIGSAIHTVHNGTQFIIMLNSINKINATSNPTKLLPPTFPKDKSGILDSKSTNICKWIEHNRRDLKFI